jgi:hypothetical protein
LSADQPVPDEKPELVLADPRIRGRCNGCRIDQPKEETRVGITHREIVPVTHFRDKRDAML